MHDTSSENVYKMAMRPNIKYGMLDKSAFIGTSKGVLILRHEPRLFRTVYIHRFFILQVASLDRIQ